MAASLNGVANLLQARRDHAAARPLYERALAIREKVLGPEHPLTQRCQSYYARLLLTTSRSAEALQRAQAALVTHEQINGSNHPWTKDSARVTADVLDALCRGAEAAALREKYGIVRAKKN